MARQFRVILCWHILVLLIVLKESSGYVGSNAVDYLRSYLGSLLPSKVIYSSEHETDRYGDGYQKCGESDDEDRHHYEISAGKYKPSETHEKLKEQKPYVHLKDKKSSESSSHIEHEKHHEPYDHHEYKEKHGTSSHYGHKKCYKPSLHYGHKKRYEPSSQYGHKKSHKPYSHYGHKKRFKPYSSYGHKKSCKPYDNYGHNENHEPSQKKNYEAYDHHEYEENHESSSHYGYKESYEPSTHYEQKDSYRPSSKYEYKKTDEPGGHCKSVHAHSPIAEYKQVKIYGPSVKSEQGESHKPSTDYEHKDGQKPSTHYKYKDGQKTSTHYEYKDGQKSSTHYEYMEGHKPYAHDAHMEGHKPHAHHEYKDGHKPYAHYTRGDAYSPSVYYKHAESYEPMVDHKQGAAHLASGLPLTPPRIYHRDNLLDVLGHSMQYNSPALPKYGSSYPPYDTHDGSNPHSDIITDGDSGMTPEQGSGYEESTVYHDNSGESAVARVAEATGRSITQYGSKHKYQPAHSKDYYRNEPQYDYKSSKSNVGDAMEVIEQLRDDFNRDIDRLSETIGEKVETSSRDIVCKPRYRPVKVNSHAKMSHRPSYVDILTKYSGSRNRY